MSTDIENNIIDFKTAAASIADSDVEKAVTVDQGANDNSTLAVVYDSANDTGLCDSAKPTAQKAPLRYMVAKAICEYDALHCHKWARRTLTLAFGIASGLAMLPINPLIAAFAVPAAGFIGDVVNDKLQPGVKLRNWACGVSNKHEGCETYQRQSIESHCKNHGPA